MQQSSEFDGMIKEISDFLNQFAASIEEMVNKLNTNLLDNSGINEAYNARNVESLDEQLQDKSNLALVYNLMHTRDQKGIGLRIKQDEITIEYVVPFLNFLIEDLYDEGAPFKFCVEVSQEAEFYLFLNSKEPLSKLNQIQVVFARVMDRLEEIQKALLTESAWQLDVTATAYFHSTLNPAIVYYMMILYSASKIRAGIEFDSIEQMQSNILSAKDGAKIITDCKFYGESIRQILSQNLGFKNLYFPFDKEGHDSELIKCCKMGAEVAKKMSDKRSFTESIKSQIECLEKMLAITKISPSTAMFYKHKYLQRLSFDLQLLMDGFSQLTKISAKDAIKFKRKIEAIKKIFDEVELNELCDESVPDIIDLCNRMSTIYILSLSDNEISAYENDVVRKNSLRGSCYNMELIIDLFKRLSVHSDECMRRGRFIRFDSMWTRFWEEIKKFLARVTAVSINGMGEAARLQLSALVDLMSQLLAVNGGGKSHQWQAEVLLFMCNTLKILSIKLSEYKECLFITRFIANLSPTSPEFKSSCDLVGGDLLVCFENLINHKNSFLYINRAAYALNHFYRTNKVDLKGLINSCGFLLERLSDCNAQETSKKNVRENLTKLKEIMVEKLPKPVAEKNHHARVKQNK